MAWAQHTRVDGQDCKHGGVLVAGPSAMSRSIRSRQSSRGGDTPRFGMPVEIRYVPNRVPDSADMSRPS